MGAGLLCGPVACAPTAPRPLLLRAARPPCPPFVRYAAHYDARHTSAVSLGALGKSQSRKQDAAPEWSDAGHVVAWERAGMAMAALTASAALLFCSCDPAFAAGSGGRMGGSAFSSSSSPSSGFQDSGSSSTLGRGADSSFLQQQRSQGARSLSSPAARSSGGHHLSVTGRSALAPAYMTPLGGGGGGFGLTSLLFWGVFAFIMVKAAQGVLGGGGGSRALREGDDPVSVAKLQVALLGSARGLQRDLERIASRADTSGPAGLHFILQETVLALLRNPDYAVYGYGKSGREDSPDAAENRFNALSLEERRKFEAETLVNVGGRKRQSSLNRQSSGPNELIVVTILAAVAAPLKLPRVTSREELLEALSKLGGVRSEDVLAVEVLWTPEEEGDTFTQEDLFTDYPQLNNL
ncbi:CPLD42 [Auxenochlorella protothecoides x Auxenochlorella symbiontica]